MSYNESTTVINGLQLKIFFGMSRRDLFIVMRCVCVFVFKIQNYRGTSSRSNRKNIVLEDINNQLPMKLGAFIDKKSFKDMKEITVSKRFPTPSFLEYPAFKMGMDQIQHFYDKNKNR